MRALLVCLLIACGSPTSAPHQPRTTARSQPGPAGKPTTPPPNPSGPSESECDALFTHAFALSIGDRKPSDADRTALATELRPGFVADCRAGTRTYHQCGLAAKSQTDLAACKR